MSLSLYDASVPVFVQMMTALSAVLDKAAAHAEAKKIDPAVLLALKLSPDMFPLSRQVQLATDFVKGPVSRLAGVEPPKYPDVETTIAELKTRIQTALTYAKSIDPAVIAAAADKDITIQIAGQPMTLKGKTYFFHFALPNFYFHVTAAYAILRSAGVEIGKRDFVGGLPS